MQTVVLRNPGSFDLMENGRINTTPWITHRMSLAAVPQEFPGLLRQPAVVKAMVDVDRF